MQCKLCLTDTVLLKKSHILSDFLYSGIFDNNHRIIKLSLEDNKSKYVQSGEYESDILCAKCDNVILNQYETYASSIFYPKTSASISTQYYRKDDGLEYTIVQGIDYTKFKLFLLSLLWRASISKKSFFTKIVLGKYEDKIRQMLLQGDPGEENSYPCIISSYHKLDLPTEIVGEPKAIKIHVNGQKYKNIGYAFLISGWVFIFKIIENDKDSTFLEAGINKSGKLLIPHITHDQGVKILNKYFNKEIFI